VSESRPVAVVVLAAGEGTRMKSRIPKVLHSVCGRSLLGHALAAASELDPQRLVIVVGHHRDQVSAEAERHSPGVCVVVQHSLEGTGHAVRMVTEALGVLPGTVVVTYADMPLLRARTLHALVREHGAAGNAVTVLTARVGDPSDYGRIVRDSRGSLAEIVEAADATPEQRAIDEINSGCYAFDGALLADAVKRVATGNAQGQGPTGQAPDRTFMRSWLAITLVGGLLIFSAPEASRRKPPWRIIKVSGAWQYDRRWRTF